MTASIGITGSAATWAGTFNSELVAGLTDLSFTVQLTGDAHAVPPFGVAYTDQVVGLRSWSGTIRGTMPTPGIPDAGSITIGGSGYTSNINEWSLDIRGESFDVTDFTASARWRKFTPGLYSWSGTYGGFLDTTNALVLPGAHATCYFVIGVNRRFNGDIITTGIGVAAQPTSPNTIAYTFVGDGTVSAETPSGGTDDETGWSADTPATPVALTAPQTAGSLVLTAATNRTYTGSAFMTGLRIRCNVAAPVEIEIAFQGTDALTPA